MLTLVSPEGRQEVQNQALLMMRLGNLLSRHRKNSRGQNERVEHRTTRPPYAPRLHEERRRFPMFYPIVLRSSQVPSSVNLAVGMNKSSVG